YIFRSISVSAEETEKTVMVGMPPSSDIHQAFWEWHATSIPPQLPAIRRITISNLERKNQVIFCGGGEVRRGEKTVIALDSQNC
ncbi:unnamed protein product, partial [Darwinula stevensoni]